MTWQPTHRVSMYLHGRREVWLVMATADGAYTDMEWATLRSPAWSQAGGLWRLRGRPAPWAVVTEFRMGCAYVSARCT